MARGLQFEVKEKIDPRIRLALIEQFPDAITAFLELTDNAIADKEPGTPIEIRITITNDAITITNKGGRGMDRQDLERFLEWGAGERRDIFRYYGQGGKAALAYLSNSWRVYSTPKRKRITYVAEMHDWAHNMDQLRSMTVKVEPALFDFPTVSIQVRQLRRKLSAKSVRTRLGEVYSPLLEKGDVHIWVNGVKAIPVFLPVIPGSKEEFSEILSQGVLAGWCGLKLKDSPTRSGIRCYSQGRLVTNRELFGIDVPGVDASLIIGEMDLSFVPITSLKAGYDKSSTDWEFASVVASRHLQPLTRRISPEDETSEGLQKMLPEVRKMVDEALAKVEEWETGRKPPEPRPEGQKKVVPSGTGSPTTHPSVTPPPAKRTGVLSRKVPWDVDALGEDTRAQVNSETGTILINRRFPAFHLFQRDKHMLVAYCVETLVLEKLSHDGVPGNEIKDRVNHALRIAVTPG